MAKSFLIYGANGYTGELITRYAVERGMTPILAGRNAIAVEALAKKHHLEYRVFSLDEKDRLDSALQEVEVVLHCAGPFSLTSRPMVEACLRNKKHYTDITGEIAVFEAMARLDQKAKDAGIMIMPGVGFDVVPSDCLARHLKDRLPSATNLTLAFYGKGSRISHGTQATMTMNIGNGGAIRRTAKSQAFRQRGKRARSTLARSQKRELLFLGEMSLPLFIRLKFRISRFTLLSRKNNLNC